METIINVVMIAILFICLWSGYKKGLIMCIGGILAILVSLYGANLIANTITFDVTSAMRPFASGYMESTLRRSEDEDEDEEAEHRESVLEQMGWEDSDLSVEDLLNNSPQRKEEFCMACYGELGLSEEISSVIAEEAVAYAEDNNVTTIDAAVQVLCEKISYVAIFSLAFVMILILLTVIGNLPNLSYKLPNLDLFNDISGALLGVVTGMMFCMILVWVLRFFGLFIGVDTLSKAKISSFFLEHNLLTRYIGI